MVPFKVSSSQLYLVEGKTMGKPWKTYGEKWKPAIFAMLLISAIPLAPQNHRDLGPGNTSAPVFSRRKCHRVKERIGTQPPQQTLISPSSNAPPSPVSFHWTRLFSRSLYLSNSDGNLSIYLKACTFWKQHHWCQFSIFFCYHPD